MQSLLLIIPFLICSGSNFLFVYLTKKKFGYTFPFALIGLTLLFYLFSYLTNMSIAYIVCLAIGLLGWTLFIVLCFKKDKIHISDFLSIGFNISFLLFLFVIIYQWGRNFHFVDEYSFWGVMVKESYRLKDFYIIDESNLFYNKEYPPFFTLIETFWCFACNAFEERFCFMALNFFSLSLFLPVLEKNYEHTKSLLKTGLLLVSFLILGYVIGYTDSLCYDTFFYNSIYIDWPLAYLIGFLFYTIIESEWKPSDFIFLCMGLSALTLSKQISIAFWLLILVTAALIITFRKLWNKRNILLFIIAVGIPLLFLASWNHLVDYYDIASKFNASDINFLFIIDAIKGNLNDIQLTTYNSFINALFNHSLIRRPIGMCYVFLIAAITVLLLIKAFFSKNKKIIITSSVMYLLGGVGYAYAMLLSYVYLFGYSEGPGVTMFDRYMLIYVLAGLFLLAVIYSEYIEKSLKYGVLELIVIGLTISPGTIRVSVPQVHHYSIYDEMFENVGIYDSLVSEDESILVISQTDAEKEAAMRYALLNSNNTYEFIDLTYAGDYDFDNGEALWEDDFWKLLSEYDYIYLLSYDESFTNHFWYTDEKALIDKLYKVDYIGDYTANIYLVK